MKKTKIENIKTQLLPIKKEDSVDLVVESLDFEEMGKILGGEDKQDDQGITGCGKILGFCKG